jgi:hypothetical protein
MMNTMVRFRQLSTVCLLALVSLWNNQEGQGAEPLVRAGDRVALLGGTLIESLQARGDLETNFQLVGSDLRVRFRNVGWSGDDCYGSARRVFGGPAEGYARLLQDLQAAKPTLVLVGYGFAEASNGVSAARRFETGLQKLATDLQKMNCRIVFMLPFRIPGVKTVDYEESVAIVRKGVSSVAVATSSTTIDPQSSLAPLGQDGFDDAGLRLSTVGSRRLGDFIAASLLGTNPMQFNGLQVNETQYGELAALVAEKDAMFFHSYRPMNETYLFLFRKHEQGNNAVETEQFAERVEAADESIWQRAAQLGP